MWPPRLHRNPRAVWAALGRRRFLHRARAKNQCIGASVEVSHYGDPIICRTGQCLWADGGGVPFPAGKGGHMPGPGVVRVSWGLEAPGGSEKIHGL